MPKTKLEVIREAERRTDSAQMQKKLRAFNERNRQYWETESKKFEERITKRPADAAIAAKMQTDEIKRVNTALLGTGMTDEQRSRTALKAAKNIEAYVADFANSRLARQSEIARKSRPRNSELHRCIEGFLRTAKEAGRRVTWKDALKHVRENLGENAARQVTASLVSRLRKTPK